ncbi:MAG TPA: pyridoxal phosphate-dependent aminotransferase [Rhizobiales bacterium]|nr:pyridoxal phosphate-dependent aminotransferase [Hyphomicrobiales bacterium]
MLKLNQAVTQVSEEGAFAVSDRAMMLKSQGHPVINLGIGQPDFLPPAHILEAAEKAARDGPHGYTSPLGILPLREAVADQVGRRYDLPINPGQVIIVPGGKVTIFFAAMLFGGREAEILCPDPGFPPYREAILSAGARPVAYGIHEAADFGFDAQEVLDLITEKTSLVIVNSPANPTGGVVSQGEMKKLADGLVGHPRVAILSDEIYGELVYEKSQFVSMLQFEHLRDRTIILDGWSKTFAMTGWRLGYGIWPLDLVDHVRKLITVDHSCVNGVAQMAGLAATTGPTDCIDGFLASFRQRRDLLVKGLNDLPGISCRMPGGAFYAFPNVTGTGLESQELAHRLLEEVHVATIAGDAFGDNGRGYIRFSYAASQNELRQALVRMGDFLRYL